ncbi:calcium/sodium antiporter [Alkalilimnicola sp. S0819]|nr:calcium/sodium antiporter [Alkalilimnicola sp. S0819]MPQ15440.1 calcium/sodium antiporter [Alkalilimnicola sp. S0819]
MLLSLVAVVGGIVLLIWSADRFVEGSAGTARHFNVSPLLIGMLIVGFGTSAPEVLVSVLAAWQGNPGLGLGNAFGSNITNIALILGVTALLYPVAVHSRIIRKELPVLIGITALAIGLAWDGHYSRLDAAALLLVFLALMGWSVWEGLHQREDALAAELASEYAGQQDAAKLGRNVFWLLLGLVLLIASSRVLVWGAVNIAQWLGVSDLVIGLTVIAVGTSLPELASTLSAVRKQEHDIALGNIIGSNFFNTLLVVGLAIMVQPTALPPELLSRDLPVMGALTLLLFVMAYGIRGPGRVNRVEGGALVGIYVAYTAYLLVSNMPG